ncbi:LCP family protein required for cell wall assembly [Nocardioides thalensis]|uniref:LCP family protein required for cell wall assembly n=1 Tax=Nocardioides thalensis TaxID=1914755 RepID=A0A853C815_9ACTN|nr:LCP family protein [Nocardioides thalensis]NYJ02363.1 LCP family protein required for cell wall assembly [Nocardioides thalensis]
MSDAGSKGPDGDQPGFDWLYGKKGQAGQGDRPAPPPPPPPAPRPPADDHPERTRLMPTQPQGGEPPYQQRPTTRPTPPQVAPAPGAPPPSRGRSGRSGWARPGRWIKIVLALLLLWVVYLVAVPLWTWSKVDKIAFEPEGDRPDDQPGTTYLMVGSDSRAGLSEEERKKYATGNSESSLADTIMILHTGSGPSVLISFPRDWTIDGSKINGFYDPGDPTALVKTLEQQTGIRIDEYMEIGLGGVAGVVDAVGGVEICPKEDITDPKAGLKVKKGCQEADGEVALAYARTRATTLGDLDRVGRQREVVAAIGDKVLSPWSVLNPFRYWNLNGAIPDFFAFGEGTGPIDGSRWALAMSRVGGSGMTCTMPVTDGSATEMDRERADPLWDAIIEDRTDDITKAQCTVAGLPR